MYERTGIRTHAILFSAFYAGFLTVAAAPRPIAAQSTATPPQAGTTTGTSRSTTATGTTNTPPETNATAANPVANQTNAVAAPTAKHVWTNDDVSGLHDQAGISTIGANGGKAPVSNVAKGKPKPTMNYHDQIAKLQAQIPPIDQQIATLQAAISGKAIDETRKYAGVKLDDWPSELADLQKKHSDIDAQIATLQDEARHAGVPANTLP
jgi:hypothetical protein